MLSHCRFHFVKKIYRQTFDIRRPLVGYKNVDHSDAVGARLSALLQQHLRSRINMASIEWAKTVAILVEKS